MFTSHASSPAAWNAESISLSPLLPSCRSTHTLGLEPPPPTAASSFHASGVASGVNVSLYWGPARVGMEASWEHNFVVSVIVVQRR